MEKKSYSDKLKDPRWQKKRLEILERDHWACVVCGDKEETLHIHHIAYLYGKEPWDIPNGLLITMCECCHMDDDIPGEIVKEIADILNTIWSQRPCYGRDGFEALCNAYYILKPE